MLLKFQKFDMKINSGDRHAGNLTTAMFDQY